MTEAPRLSGAARALAWLVALAFFASANIGTVRWIGEHGGVGPAWRHFWDAVASDRMVQLWLLDFAIFVTLAVCWFWRDATRRGWSLAARVALAVGVLLLGSPVLLVYLATHAAPPRSA